MNIRRSIATVWEDSQGNWKASRERSPKISHQIVYTGKYRYIKCTRLQVQVREKEGGRT